MYILQEEHWNKKYVINIRENGLDACDNRLFLLY